MATFTRRELRSRQINSANFSSAVSWSLVNNLKTQTYFTIEGGVVPEGNGERKNIFNTASITNPVNCSFISESMHSAFIINPSSTATFVFTPSSTINKEDVEFIATNVLFYDMSNPSVSGSATGSAVGVTLDTNA